MKRIDDFLRAADGESWDDHFSTPPGRTDDNVKQFLFDVGQGMTQSAAIGALADQIIRASYAFRIPDDGQTGPSEIARKDQPYRFLTVLYRNDGKRRTQNMTGIEKFHRHAGDGTKGTMIPCSPEIVETFDRIAHRVQRFDRGVAVIFPAVEVFGFAFLNMPAVYQHGAAQIACGERGVDVAPRNPCLTSDGGLPLWSICA